MLVVLLRVDSVLSGTQVVGGGLTQMYFQNSGGDVEAVIDAVESFWGEAKAVMSNGVTVAVQADVPVFAEATGALDSVLVGTPDAPQTGALSGDALPPATQALIRWNTAGVVNNRVLKGRTFIPGITENGNVTGGVPSSAVITALNAARDALLLDGVANFGIWHRPVAGSGGLWYLAEAGSVWGQFAVLRSRRD